MHVIILAGGGGTRLWPLSSKECPKQFLPFKGNESLLQQTVKRFLSCSLFQTVVVSTNPAFETLVQQQLSGSGVKIFIEPYRRNTGPAVALAIRYLEEFCGAQSEDPILITPSDHLIEPQNVFLDYLLEGLKASVQGKIVTFGIRPKRAETGYGYLKIGAKSDAFTYQVEEFVEKPSLQKVTEFLENPQYYWNSGVFAFTANTFWEESKIHYTEIFSLKEMAWSEIISRFEACSNLSIDYALMEKSKNMVVCPMPVSWADIGSWESLYQLLDKDLHRNVKVGNVIDLSTHNCFIYGGRRVISTIGLEGLLIIDTEDALLIADRSESERIKDLVGRDSDLIL